MSYIEFTFNIRNDKVPISLKVSTPCKYVTRAAANWESRIQGKQVQTSPKQYMVYKCLCSRVAVKLRLLKSKEIERALVRT